MLYFSLKKFLQAASIVAVLLLSGCAAQFHHRAGMVALEKSDYTLAVKELQQASDLSPGNVIYRKDWLQVRETGTARLLAKAASASASGNSGLAEKTFRAVLEIDPRNAQALAGLEIIASTAQAADDVSRSRESFKRGEYPEALQWANRALLRMPAQREAAALVRDIESLSSKNIVSSPSLSALYKKPINLEFRDASVKMVFEALSRTTGINFIFDREVKGDQRTTVFLKQTTLEDAIDVLLTTNQLEKKILNASSVLVYPNTTAKIKEYQDLVVRAFYPTNVEAKQAANMLKMVLKIKDVFVDDKSNMLVLRETPETLVLAEKLMSLHDLEEPEVMLEVEVLEVNRSRLQNLGIQFTDQLTVSPLGLTSSGSTGSPTTAPTLKLSELLSLNKDKLSITAPSATINIQKIDGDANLLANPRLRVRDREKARILIGDKVPVVTTSSTPNGFLSENITYLDVGLKLEVEPEIYRHDEIGLKMSLEVSSLVAVIKTASGSQAYQIGTRNVTTSLRLRDGETQVLAGLISDADRSSANRVPLVGELPLLGRLFSSQKNDKTKTEIVMSITPHLVRNLRRKDPALESFWSGTETNLRTKALTLGTFEVSKPLANAAPNSGLSPVVPVAAAAVDLRVVAEVRPNTSGITLQWNGPSAAQVGQFVTLDLVLSSAPALRAVPMQLAYDPKQLDIVAVKEGEFFNKTGGGSFNSVVDKVSGRVSLSAAGQDAGVQGSGRIFTVTMKALTPGESEISVIGITPVGARQAVGQPQMPAVHKLTIVQ